jgi:NTP pyrophosphatase (non-canonical NTP hydrolase)
MPLSEYQQQIDDSVQKFAVPYWAPLSILARITEEVGEVARILNAQYGDKPKKPDEEHELLEDEIADVMYALLALANSQGLNMDAAMDRSIAKLETRDKDRFERKPA